MVEGTPKADGYLMAVLVIVYKGRSADAVIVGHCN